jgi:hypothetical protein
MCLGVSSLRFVHEVPNIFRTGSEKLGKKAKSLKIFFSRTISATGEPKTCFRIPKRSFLKFVRGNFL